MHLAIDARRLHLSQILADLFVRVLRRTACARARAC